MTPTEFKTLLDSIQTEAGLNMLMSQHWPEVVATPAEFRELNNAVLARYEAVCCRGCDGMRDSRPAQEEIEV